MKTISVTYIETPEVVFYTPKQRLEYLRGELRAERMSYGELAEPQSLVEYIEPGDVELLEAAGAPEDDTCPVCGASPMTVNCNNANCDV